MNTKTYSLLLDFFQISTILLILGTGSLFVNNLTFLLQILAILIISLAAWEMRRTRYYRVPDIGKQSELVTTGIYKYIRNPMYLAQLLFMGTLVLNSNSLLRTTAFIVLLVDLLLKIRYEERLLNSFFKEFKEYLKNSWRLIPYLY